MANEKKYQRQTKGFQQFRESLAFTPKQVGDEMARQRAANTATEQQNYENQGLADLASFQLLRSQQKMIDEANDRAAAITERYRLQDVTAFSNLAQMGIHHMAAKEQRDDQKKAYSDFLELSKNPELLKKVMTPYRNNVKLNDENVRKMTQLAFTLDSGGEELALVKRVLNNGGHYNQSMLRLMKANVLEDIPTWMAQELNTKVGIPDHVYPGITEPISIEDIKEGGKYHKELQERDPDGSVEQYLNARASKGITDILSEWYSPEAVMADFQPAINKHFGKRDLSGGADAKAFWNSETQRELRDVTVAEAKTLDPDTFVYELLKDIEAQAPYMGSVKEAFQTKLNQLLVAFENGEITLGQLRGIETALVNSKDHTKIGFEGVKEFGEWRKDNFGAVNWQTRIDQHIKAQGEKAKEGRKNAITNLQGQIYQYTIAEKGKKPPREIIQEWISSMDENGQLYGMSQFEAFDKATEGMTTQQGDTIEQMKIDLKGSVAQSGGISAEVVANYPPEIRDWLEDQGWILDPAFEPDESAKSDFNTLLDALVKQSMKQEGAYDRPLTEKLIRKNGADWLRKRYTDLRKGNEIPKDALAISLKELQKKFDDDIESWMVFKHSDGRTKELTGKSIDEWTRNGFSFDSPLTALEDRLEGLAVHLRSGGRIHKDLTYKADDGNYYSVFDDTLTQLAARSGKTAPAILREQLEGMGIQVSLDGEFKYLNADRRTQYIMERGGAGQIRAKVNASIKDSHLEKLEINQDGGKNFYGIPMARLNDTYLEEATGIDAAYINSVEEGGFRSIMNKLGIKQHELLNPNHVKLIQKRVLSEHGAIALGTVDTDETGQASFTYNADEANLTPGLTSAFKNDLNQRHFDTPMRITYATARDKGTPIGTTKPANFGGGTLVFGIVSGSGTSVHLGWRHIDSQEKWIQELAKTQGKFYE
jgi:hypothetical protein